MSHVRLQRVASLMKRIIGDVVAHELKDPRIGFLTIVDVKVAADLKTASVAFSVLGPPAGKRLAAHALERARGFIQARVAQEAQLKYTPVLAFHLDESAERDIAISRKIENAVSADRRTAVARAIRARVAAKAVPDDLLDELARAAADPQFTEHLAGLLVRLIDVDSTPRPDPAALADAEARCFQLIEDELRGAWPDALETERLPIPPEIGNEPEYTPPAYAAAPGQTPPEPAVAYAGRANLLAVLRRAELEDLPPPPDGLHPLRIALNAHVDTIGPHIPASRSGGLVLGRGACDAKGQVVTILAAFRLLRRLRDAFGVRLLADLSAQFVIDEESGGNGSLSLALEDPAPFDAMLIAEATDLSVYTANRGAVWYRAELTAPPDRILELAAHVVLALEDEGRAIRAESDHALFPHRPVQTNHGIIGPFGSAPPAVCGLVRVRVRSTGLEPAELRVAVDRALAEYVAAYGDKTAERDPDSGSPLLARHVDFEEAEPGMLAIAVHGIAGHMGALARCDGAITKAAFIVRALAALRAPGRTLDLALDGHDSGVLVLEGGQGFLPTHTLRQVTDRLAAAAARAAALFAEQNRLAPGAVRAVMTFDRLHNNAYIREPDCALAVYAAESARRAGIVRPSGPAGWDVSCDARIFADFFRTRDVVVFGPGELRHAHAPAESVRLQDIVAAARMLAVLALEASGFVR